MIKREQRYYQREKRKGTSMGDTGGNEAKAFFRRSEELHISMSETLKEVAQLLRGFDWYQNFDKPTNDKDEGQPDRANEMDRLHAEYDALSAAIRDNMTFTEYYGLKTKGGHRRKRYCLKDRLDGETDMNEKSKEQKPEQTFLNEENSEITIEENAVPEFAKPALMDQLCGEIQSSMEAIMHEDNSGMKSSIVDTQDLREEPLMIIEHKEHSDLHGHEKAHIDFSYMQGMTAKAARRTCDFQLDTPHRLALIKKQPFLEEDMEMEHTSDEPLEMRKQEEHIDVCKLEKRYDLKTFVGISSFHHEVHEFPLLENPLKF